MEKKWLIFSGIHGFCAVALGAFAAHGLKQVLDAEALAWVETGAKYQMYHALALLGLAALSFNLSEKSLSLSGWGFALGPLVFSGSLYGMALTGMRFLGAVVPLGGLLMLGAWLNLLIFSLRYPWPSKGRRPRA